MKSYLHSTIFILIHGIADRLKYIIENLHSTIFILIRAYANGHKEIPEDLHSTIFILIHISISENLSNITLIYILLYLY